MKISRNVTIGVICLYVASMLSGCAGANYRPIVDTKGVDSAKYEVDLRECQSYATQTAGAGETAAAGAVIGALLGAALAAAAGGGYSRDNSAKVGALSGAVGAGAEGEKSQRDIIRRCMSGRGYNVLR